MFNFFQSNVAVHSHLALSGVSVQYALGMLALATNGTTQEEVLRAMEGEAGSGKNCDSTTHSDTGNTAGGIYRVARHIPEPWIITTRHRLT